MTTSPQIHFSIPVHQSGFTKHHSTETLLFSLYNKLVSAVSHQKVSCLCLLDISAAFDTIDHIDFLLGLASLGLLYSGSNHIYLLGNSLSKPLTTPHNPSHAPVGSLKAPSWIRSSSFYTPHLIETSSVDHHLYADDTQLFISFSPASFSTSIAHLLSVVNQISQWMSSNLLCL